MTFFKSRQPDWYSTKAEWNDYWSAIRPFCEGKVIADIGCGNAELWTADTKHEYKFLHLLDIVLHLEANRNVSSLPKNKVSLWHAGPAIMRHINPEYYPHPTVALLKDVCQFLTYAEIRSLLFGLPDSVTTLIITTRHSQASVARLATDVPPRAVSWASTPFNFRFSLNKICGADPNMFLVSVTHDLNQWKAKQDSLGIWEPCPRCSSHAHIDSCIVTDMVEVMCMNCGFSFVDKGPNSHVLYQNDYQLARLYWNSKVRKIYTLTDDKS